MKTNNIIISYWFKPLDYNPISRIQELEKCLDDFIKPCLVSNAPISHNLNIPRIQTTNKERKSFFSLSMINCIVNLNVEGKDNDELILFINENMQLYMDILKDIFDIDIIYSSVKMEFQEKDIDANKFLIKKYDLKGKDLEDINIKKVERVDDYYISYNICSGHEINYNFTISNQEDKPTDEDLYFRGMVTSVKDAVSETPILSVGIEINDRYAYNENPNFRSSKESIRGIVQELRKLLDKDIKEY